MLSLLAMQPIPPKDNLAILTAIIDQYDLDINAIWALIDAYNYGVIDGKRAERTRIRK